MKFKYLVESIIKLKIHENPYLFDTKDIIRYAKTFKFSVDDTQNLVNTLLIFNNDKILSKDILKQCNIIYLDFNDNKRDKFAVLYGFDYREDTQTLFIKFRPLTELYIGKNIVYKEEWNEPQHTIRVMFRGKTDNSIKFYNVNSSNMKVGSEISDWIATMDKIVSKK